MNQQLNAPVLDCAVDGDQEGRTSKQLGYYSGRIEDILRLVAPKATHSQARFGADYEVDVWYYDSTEDTYRLLSTSFLSEKEKHPDIISVCEQKPINAKVLVTVDKDKVEQFISRLLPGTHFERLNYADGTPSPQIIIDI